MHAQRLTSIPTYVCHLIHQLHGGNFNKVFVTDTNIYITTILKKKWKFLHREKLHLPILKFL